MKIELKVTPSELHFHINGVLYTKMGRYYLTTPGKGNVVECDGLSYEDIMNGADECLKVGTLKDGDKLAIVDRVAQYREFL